MKFSQIINYPLGLIGLKLGRKPVPVPVDNPLKDIEADENFQQIFRKIEEYTMVSPEKCYALYQAVKYIINNNIKGDFAECGVWKGGSCMMIAYLLGEAGIADRTIYLYDTFEGMTKPGLKDGEEEKRIWEEKKTGGEQWCYSPVEEVMAAMQLTGYAAQNIKLIKGKVEETIPGELPSQLALLRLDTDWYESTKHELVHLYPLLIKQGVLIIDDYGTWEGARKATDEYFADNGPVYLHRIDLTGRLVIK